MRLIFALFACLLGALFTKTAQAYNSSTGQVFAFVDRSCAIITATIPSSGHRLTCWGLNDDDKNLTMTNLPASRLTRPEPVAGGHGAVMAGGHHVNSCYLKDNNLYCLGENHAAQLLNPDPLFRTITPVLVISDVVSFSFGAQHACAIRTSGALQCWGSNFYGQVGNGGYSYGVYPQHTVFADSVTAVAAGNDHTCAIRNGALYCWGDNTFGQLGVPAPPLINTPNPVPYMNSDVTAVVASGSTTCAIRDNTLYCWGENKQNAYLGVGNLGHRTAPEFVAAHVSGVAKSPEGGCLIATWPNIHLRCWGLNSQGNVGNGRFGTPVTTPVSVVLPYGDTPVAIAHGHNHALARGRSGCLYAWGYNNYGQLGDGNAGSNLRQLTPTLVSRSCVGHFEKISPQRDATNQPINPTLAWTTPLTGSVDHYRYIITSAAGLNVPPTNIGLVNSFSLSGLAPNTLHRWQIRACADPDCYVFMGADNFTRWDFTTANVPGFFDKITPTHNAVLTDPPSALTWGGASGVDHYRICVDFAHNPPCTPNTPIGRVTSIVSSDLPLGLAHGNVYRWQVRACAEPSCSVFRDAGPIADGPNWIFSVEPMPFTKQSPANGATDQPAALTLRWSSSGGTHHYRYCIATTSGCTPGTSVGPSTSVTVSDLLSGTTYYWQVRACANRGCTLHRDADGGAVHTFSVINPPGDFRKVEPPNGAMHQPLAVTLTWESASAPLDHYRYCIATAAGCVPTITVENATLVAVSGLAPDTTYYWQVRACADPGCTVFNDANGSGGHFSFTTAQLPGPFSKSSPIPNAPAQPLTVTLIWQPATYAHHYRYCVSAAPGCTPLTSVGAATNTIFIGIPGQSYYWQVRACSEAACSAFRDADIGAWRFTIATTPTVFTKSLPAPGATNQPLALTLGWSTGQHTANVHHFRYCISSTPGCVPTIPVGLADAVFVSGLSPATTYRWQVRACADALCSVFVDAGGGHWPFTTIDLPAVPAKLSPPDASGNHGRNVTLAWHVPGSPSVVQLCYDDQINGRCDGAWIDVTGSANYVLTSLAENARYEWQVRACADALCNVFSDADGGSYHHFSTAPTPPDFTKRAPFDGDVVTDVQAWLTWEITGGVVNHYRYCFAEAPSSCDPSFILRSDMTATLGGPFHRGITYTWQVRACADPECTIYADADGGRSWSFLVAVDGFSKLRPLNYSAITTTVVELAWQSADGAERYEYCVVPRGMLCASWASTTGTSATISLARGITYTWQVRACTGSACSDANEGESWEFTILSPLEVIANAQKILLSATPRYNQDALYAIRIVNTIGEGFVFTLTEQLPPSATLSVSAVEATAPITYIGLIGGAPSWLVAIPANALTQITVPVRYQPQHVGQVVAGRVVTNTVLLSDGLTTTACAISHAVHPHRAFIPMVGAYCDGRPMPPDDYEGQDGAGDLDGVTLNRGAVISRTLHDASDVDRFVFTTTLAPGEFIRLSVRVSSAAYNQQVTIYRRLVDGVTDSRVEREFRMEHGHGEVQVVIRNDDAYRRTVVYQLVVDGRDIRPQYCRTTYTVRLD